MKQKHVVGMIGSMLRSCHDLILLFFLLFVSHKYFLVGSVLLHPDSKIKSILFLDSHVSHDAKVPQSNFIKGNRSRGTLGPYIKSIA